MMLRILGFSFQVQWLGHGLIHICFGSPQLPHRELIRSKNEWPKNSRMAFPGVQVGGGRAGTGWYL